MSIAPVDLELRLENNRLRARQRVAMQAAAAFGAGKLRAVSMLSLNDGTAILPAQFKALTNWPDGSIKHLLVDFLADLAPRQVKLLRLTFQAMPASHADGPQVMVEEQADYVAANTGLLQFRVPRRGPSLLAHVVCDGQAHPLTQLHAQIAKDHGKVFELGIDAVTVECAGPVRAVIRVDGEHRDAAGARCMRWRARLTAYAGDRVVSVEYALINSEAPAHTTLERVSLGLQTEGNVQGFSGRAAVQAGWRQTVGPDFRLLTYDVTGKRLEAALPRTEPEAVGFTVSSAGVAAQLVHFKQQLPKAWRMEPRGVALDLWPAGEPLVYPRATGKMHELKLAFFGPTSSRDEALARLAMHDDVPRAAQAAADLERSGAVRDLFTAGLPARQYSRIEMAIKDAFTNRDLFYGMMHWGDDIGWGYTHAGRGRMIETGPDAGTLRPIYNNLEYDFPYVAFQQYLRSGEGYYFEQGRTSVLHMLHVDFLHEHDGEALPGRSAVEFSKNGVALHVTDHTGNSGWTPCHTWTGGIVQYYLLTGSHEALEKAHRIGKSLHWFVQSSHATRCFETTGRMSREYGWGLIAACDLYEGVGEARDLQTAAAFVELLRRWEERDPRLCHTGFCIAICLNGLARYLAIAPDPAAEKLFRRLLDTLFAHFMLPQGLLAFNDTETRAGCYGKRWAHGVCAGRAMAFAYQLTGDEKYLKQGVRELAYVLDSGLFRQYVFQAQLDVGIRRQWGGSVADQTVTYPVSMREIAQHVRDLFPLLEAAHARGLLQAIDYP